MAYDSQQSTIGSCSGAASSTTRSAAFFSPSHLAISLQQIYDDFTESPNRMFVKEVLRVFGSALDSDAPAPSFGHPNICLYRIWVSDLFSLLVSD